MSSLPAQQVIPTRVLLTRKAGRAPTASTRVRDHVPRYLVTLFFLTLFIPGPVHVPLGSVQLTPTRLLTIVLLSSLLFRRAIRWCWPDLAILAVFISFFASSVMSRVDWPVVEASGRLFLDTYGAYVIARYIAQDRERVVHSVRLLATVLALFSITIVIESVMAINLHQQVWSSFAAVGDVFVKELRLGMTRAMGWCSHPILLGLTYALAFPVALQSALHGNKNIGSWPWLKTVAIAIGAFFSLSSGAWNMGVLAIALCLWDWVPNRPKWKWLLFFWGAPTVYAVLEGMANRPLLRIIMMKLHMASPMAWYYRWRLYDRVYEAMPGYWWFGHGLNTPASFSGATGWSVDNQYLAILLLYGRVGVLAWIGAMATSIFYKFRYVWGRRDSQLVRMNRGIRIAILCCALVQLSVSIFSTASFILWIFMGLAIGLGNLCETEDRELTARPEPTS